MAHVRHATTEALSLFGLVSRSWDHRFHPFVEGPPIQQYASAAELAFEADVGTNAHHPPFITATWVGFAQSHQVIDLNVS
jgi:hypothetical protein